MTDSKNQCAGCQAGWEYTDSPYHWAHYEAHPQWHRVPAIPGFPDRGELIKCTKARYER